jgi:hypothetical protein
MSHFAALALAAAAVFSATTASAGDRLTDVDYIKANRCKALISSSALGGQDATGIDALIKQQSRGRAPFIMQKGEDAQDSAARAIKSGDEVRKQRLVAERDGATCQAFLSGGQALTASAKSSTSSN